MKKLLVALTGLVGIVTSSVSTIATVAPTKVESQMLSWSFAEQTYYQHLSGLTPLKFSIDNINLSSMGIDYLDQLQDEYKEIHLNGLAITFKDADKPQVNTDIWYTDRREMGDEDWTRFYQKTIDDRECIVESASTIWYNTSGDLMMRLSYQVFCYEILGDGGGNVSVQTGSTVTFW